MKLKFSLKALLLAVLGSMFLPNILNAQKPSISFEPYQFSFGDSKVNAELGKLIVPENRKNPNSKNIELALVRLKCTSEKPASAPIIYLAGGPGNSGIETFKTNRYGFFSALRQIADVILLDQRGTGLSKPSLLMSPLSLPVDKPVDDPLVQTMIINYCKQNADSFRNAGIDLSAYNTNESADDVNDLRIVLGAEKISLYGYSYGTHLGLAILKRYEKNIERCVFGGINGLDQRYRYPSETDIVINNINKAIDQFPKLRKQLPDFKKLVNDVLANLEREPVSVEITVQNKKQKIILYRSDVEITCINNMGETSFIREMPQLFYQMSKGNYFRMASMVFQTVKNRPPFTIMAYTMHCASGATQQRLVKIKQEEGNAIFHNAINFPFSINGFCETMGVKDLGDDFRKDVHTSVPTLFLSADLDGRTSINDAKEVAKGFSNVTHIFLENISHDMVMGQTVDMIRDFFKGEKIQSTTITSKTFDFYGLDDNNINNKLRKELADGEANFKAAFQKLVNSDTYMSNTTLVAQAQRAISEKRFNDAIIMLETNAATYPDIASSYSFLGDAYKATGQQDLAIKNYKKALELSPINIIALRELGMIK